MKFLSCIQVVGEDEDCHVDSGGSIRSGRARRVRDFRRSKKGVLLLKTVWR